ncbi:MAG: bifunctional protein-serine/threonine kinase/phosphatase [Gammaproteobacteria bacterium]|nr:bifunctional protein-serine/threonine kinase/phosphatase [Gammaproteobacteria bacterium]
MGNQLKIAIGQYSDKGRKPVNQDFHGACIPQEPLLSSKGVTIVLADGISSSQVSQIASESAVTGFLADYYSTSDAWSVKSSAQKVLQASNFWLHAQTRQSEFRYDKDKGYVCTFSALIIKSRTAHIFHAGDTRVYAVHSNTLEQLTEDHRLWISDDSSYLSRALGVNPQLEIDYRALNVEADDCFILATDGVYEFVDVATITQCIHQHAKDLQSAAETIVKLAYDNGSDDNLSVQIVKIEQLPQQNPDEIYQQLTQLPFPPELDNRKVLDGYEILRELHMSSRSHVFLAKDTTNQQELVIKIPSVDLRGDAAYLERFLMEEWVAKRMNSPHVAKAYPSDRQRNYLYITSEYIEGQSLAQWMLDHRKPKMEIVRDIAEQIAKGLRAFHRLEMLHQDLRPNNIMIDRNGTVKIIDFGSTRVAGLVEIDSPIMHQEILGTAQYSAPEYFVGESASARSDQFSLAVLIYQMLSGRLPYGTQVAKARSKAAQNRLRYQSVLDEDSEIPAWIDSALKKALHPNPYKRYEDISEFIFDLRHPNKVYLNQTQAPLLERNPVVFWKSISALLLITVIYLLNKLYAS